MGWVSYISSNAPFRICLSDRQHAAVRSADHLFCPAALFLIDCPGDLFERDRDHLFEASENLSAQKASVEQMKNNIALEVHGAYLNLKSALEVVIATRQEVDSAEESLKVSTSRYNSGLGTNVDVLDAQVDLTQAWTDHLQALFDVEIAKAKINKAVGKTIL